MDGGRFLGIAGATMHGLEAQTVYNVTYDIESSSSIPISHVTPLACRGMEKNIADCPTMKVTNTSCKHHLNDVVISCRERSKVKSSRGTKYIASHRGVAPLSTIAKLKTHFKFLLYIYLIIFHILNGFYMISCWHISIFIYIIIKYN